MKDEYLVQSYNSNTMFRVTHRESGIHRTGIMYSGEPGCDQIAHMIDEIEAEIQSQSITAMGFPDALKAVMEEGKGMTLDPESYDEDPDAEPSFVVRMYEPVDPDLGPYLVINTRAGMWPWTPDMIAMFAYWKIID